MTDSIETDEASALPWSPQVEATQPTRAEAPSAMREELDAVIACLGDDAAQLRGENPEDERAANMDRAAELLEAMAAVGVSQEKRIMELQSAATQQAEPSATAVVDGFATYNSNGLAWAVSRWNDEVSQRPFLNIHRRTLDDVWRQVVRFFGGDPDALLGPAHDALVARQQHIGGNG